MKPFFSRLRRNRPSFALACGDEWNPPGQIVRFRLTLRQLLLVLIHREVEFQVTPLGVLAIDGERPFGTQTEQRLRQNLEEISRLASQSQRGLI